MNVELVTREDLRRLEDLLKEIKQIVQPGQSQPKKWLKSNEVRKMLNILTSIFGLCEFLPESVKCCSESTIKRDIRYINNQLSIKITFDRSKNSYVIESKLSLLSIEEILEPFDILNALNAESGLSDIVITEKYQTKGIEHIKKLITAIRGSRLITFNYVKFGLANGISRVLEPYAVKQIKGRWYVIGVIYLLQFPYLHKLAVLFT